MIMAMLMVSHPSVCGLNIEKAFEEFILIATVLQLEEHLQVQGGQLLLPVEEDQVQGDQVQKQVHRRKSGTPPCRGSPAGRGAS